MPRPPAAFHILLPETAVSALEEETIFPFLQTGHDTFKGVPGENQGLLVQFCFARLLSVIETGNWPVCFYYLP